MQHYVSFLPAESLAPITLAHNVGRGEEVDAVLTAAEDAGAREVSRAVRREWGGLLGDQLVAAGRAASARTRR
ncbi:hypothetical protein [Branchiibius hedensis]|uniref:hypothetical protein n=1 Tax=Branchiibius hedensis TaxID=672460 RepID=UPI000D6C8347|nr:hypothetical protein [Branchiibius hedensis]